MSFIKLTCGDQVRYVRDIKVCTTLSCSLVNNGHNDLGDEGLWDALKAGGDWPLIIEPDDRVTEQPLSPSYLKPFKTMAGRTPDDLRKMPPAELQSFMQYYCVSEEELQSFMNGCTLSGKAALGYMGDQG